MLSSPIILYDDPQIAPESPGDLFDSTEIDEILTLRILAMTDAEKQEMAATDTHARALLERAEGLTPAQLGRLHGSLRRPGSRLDLAPAGDGSRRSNGGKPGLASLSADGRCLAVGAHVRLNPKRRADIMDIVLKDQEAVIEAVERDFEIASMSP
jgi:hydrogenase maturation protease